MTWDFAGSDPNAPNSFTETIKAGSQDPAVPAFSLAGFGSYMDNFNGGAVAFPFSASRIIRGFCTRPVITNAVLFTTAGLHIAPVDPQ